MCRNDALGWDRIGRFLLDSGTTAADIAERNMKLVDSVSTRMKKKKKKKKKYTADDVAGDMASSMATAMDNLDAIWYLLTTPPRPDQLAANLPTAFLFFRAGAGGHALLDPVRIDVEPIVAPKTKLPRTARIALSGGPGPQGAGEATVAPASTVPVPATAVVAENPLLKSLVARRPKRSRFYVLETVNRHLIASGKQPGPDTYPHLTPGVYDGLVYLDDPAVALANVRVVVEEQPTVPPAAAGRQTGQQPTQATARQGGGGQGR